MALHIIVTNDPLRNENCTDRFQNFQNKVVDIWGIFLELAVLNSGMVDSGIETTRQFFSVLPRTPRAARKNGKKRTGDCRASATIARSFAEVGPTRLNPMRIIAFDWPFVRLTNGQSNANADRKILFGE